MKRILAVASWLALGGCATTHNVNVAPLEVQPIRVTMDVNVNIHESDTPVGAEGDETAEEDEAAADRQTPSSDAPR